MNFGKERSLRPSPALGTNNEQLQDCQSLCMINQSRRNGGRKASECPKMGARGGHVTIEENRNAGILDDSDIGGLRRPCWLRPKPVAADRPGCSRAGLC